MENSQARSYFGLEYGMGDFSSTTMDQYNVSPSGNGFGFSFGNRTKILAFEAFYRAHSFSGDILHDGSANTIEHTQSTYGASMHLYMTTQFFLTFGYAFGKVEQSLGTSVTEVVEDSIFSTYSLTSSATTSGVHYGAGFEPLSTKNFNIYASYNRTEMGELGESSTYQIGIRVLFDLNIQSVFLK